MIGEYHTYFANGGRPMPDQFKCKLFSINLMQPVGKLNDAKIALIRSSTGNRFPLTAIPENNPALLFFLNSSGQESLIVGPNQISVQIEGDDIAPDIDLMTSWLEKVVSALVLNTVSTCSIRCVAHCSVEGTDAAQASLGSLKDLSAITDVIPGVWGVGLRFLRESNDTTTMSELKVEPLLLDPSFYFIEATYNMPETTMLTEVAATAKHAYCEAKESTIKLIRRLL